MAYAHVVGQLRRRIADAVGRVHVLLTFGLLVVLLGIVGPVFPGVFGRRHGIPNLDEIDLERKLTVVVDLPLLANRQRSPANLW